MAKTKNREFFMCLAVKTGHGRTGFLNHPQQCSSGNLFRARPVGQNLLDLFLNIHKSVKSLEGSGSIFLFSFLIYTLYSIIALQSPGIAVILWIVLASLIITVVEIITPKGFDNLSIQIIAVLVFQYLIL